MGGVAKKVTILASADTHAVRVGEVQEDTSDVFLRNISGTGRDPWKLGARFTLTLELR